MCTLREIGAKCRFLFAIAMSTLWMLHHHEAKRHSFLWFCCFILYAGISDADGQGLENPAPLSPQWLLPKTGDGKLGTGPGVCDCSSDITSDLLTVSVCELALC